MWPWKRHSAETRLPESPSTLREDFSALRADFLDLKSEVKAAQRDLDDLDETVRKLRGRMTKGEALAAAAEAAGPADGPAAPNGAPKPAGKVLTVARLRAEGKWPL